MLGHDVVLGAGANIVFDNTNDTTLEANSGIGDDVTITLPAASGTVTIEPTADGTYLRQLNSGALSWVTVADSAGHFNHCW